MSRRNNNQNNQYYGNGQYYGNNQNGQYYGSNYHLPFDYPVVKKYWKETGVERFNNATSKYVQFDYIAMLLFSEFKRYYFWFHLFLRFLIFN